MKALPPAYSKDEHSLKEHYRYWLTQFDSLSDAGKCSVLDFYRGEKLFIDSYLYVYRQQLSKSGQKISKVLEGQILLILILFDDKYYMALFLAALTKSINNNLRMPRETSLENRYAVKLLDFFTLLGECTCDSKRTCDLISTILTVFELKTGIKTQKARFLRSLRHFYKLQNSTNALSKTKATATLFKTISDLAKAI